MSAETRAVMRRASKAVLDELAGRKGFDAVLDETDAATQRELGEAVAKAVLKATTPKAGT